jgi:putative chitinase
MSQTAVDWSAVQRRLGKLYAGKVDGQPGPKTWIGVVDFAAPTQPNGADATTLRGRALASAGADWGLTTAQRIAGFLSNTAHETSDYTRLRENLYYTSAARIRATWPTRFASDEEAVPYVRNAEALANKVYARPKEGNTEPGDGWRFRGGGDFQTTFRNGYRAAGQTLKLPLEEHPELIETPAVAVQAGLFYFVSNNIGRYFDLDQPKRARARVNTGNPDNPNPIGWDDVSARYDRIMGLLA